MIEITLCDSIAFQKYISAEVNCETLSFIECGGNSLSAICLAEDILCVLSTYVNNTLDLLVDVILHGRLQDVIKYLCDDLAYSKSATNLNADLSGKVKSSLHGNEFMESSALSMKFNSKDEMLPDSMTMRKAVRHLSSSDFGQTIKRSRISSDQSENSEVIDSKLSSGSGVNHLSVCHCLEPNSRQGDLLQVGRGSLRVTCCHVNCVMNTESNLQSCCVINVFKPISYLERPVCSKGWFFMNDYNFRLEFNNIEKIKNYEMNNIKSILHQIKEDHAEFNDFMKSEKSDVCFEELAVFIMCIVPICVICEI